MSRILSDQRLNKWFLRSNKEFKRLNLLKLHLSIMVLDVTDVELNLSLGSVTNVQSLMILITVRNVKKQKNILMPSWRLRDLNKLLKFLSHHWLMTIFQAWTLMESPLLKKIWKLCSINLNPRLKKLWKQKFQSLKSRSLKNKSKRCNVNHKFQK